MADSTATVPQADDEDRLKRSITGAQLFFYTLGDVLGSGIYVLIGLVAAAVGGPSGSPSPRASRWRPSPDRPTRSW